MLKMINEYFDHILSYLTAIMALVLSIPVMKVGGIILLISRLIVDLPPAYKKIMEIINGVRTRS